MSKHTPGPWQAMPPNYAGTPWTIEPGIARLYGSNNAMQMERARKGETDANARLIAAAPDLYEALDALYEAYVVDLHGRKTCDCDPSVTRATCAPCLARAALAKVQP
jgi:hypothetical protein